ncbi:MAG TPA: DUF6526 family protein [Chitinophagaceae bacterium]|nr:DUF6526 family protein [Chitinophagaceae bacterium]
MKPQHFRNHSQFVISYHVVALVLWIFYIIGAVRHALKVSEADTYDAWLLVIAGILIFFALYFSRTFALRAQDRAIRAEENLRHFALTGKLLDQRLSLSQVIALRFASDAEFPLLAQKAVAENWSNKRIKFEIKNWRADYHRV